MRACRMAGGLEHPSKRALCACKPPWKFSNQSGTVATSGRRDGAVSVPRKAMRLLCCNFVSFLFQFPPYVAKVILPTLPALPAGPFLSLMKRPHVAKPYVTETTALHDGSLLTQTT